ncbi:hypothetical protein [Sulfobacillus thermosulfidooxidans]|uniref:hypothetical protein n=1 Tax=Sulfobacillus thermosulfidooxidans TaxID=28034 RepID=UPI0006B5C761|nr:hypothetical protein [Sulfobacillus thermosulfidooxidans]
MGTLPAQWLNDEPWEPDDLPLHRETVEVIPPPCRHGNGHRAMDCSRHRWPHMVVGRPGPEARADSRCRKGAK